MKTVLVFCIFMSVAYAAIMGNIGALESKHLTDIGQAVLIDVREPLETKNGIAKGAMLLPISKMKNDRISFNKEVASIPKSKTIIVYCASGKRAKVVGEELEKQGYKVLNMGAYNSWKSAGLPIVLK